MKTNSTLRFLANREDSVCHRSGLRLKASAPASFGCYSAAWRGSQVGNKASSTAKASSTRRETRFLTQPGDVLTGRKDGQFLSKKSPVKGVGAPTGLFKTTNEADYAAPLFYGQA